MITSKPLDKHLSSAFTNCLVLICIAISMQISIVTSSASSDEVASRRNPVQWMRMKNDPVTSSRIQKMRQNGPCSLPDCFPPKSGIPGGLPASETPQLVFFTFDDAVTRVNKPFYDQLFNDERKNPNGCPIRATFFNSHNYTDYKLVAELYDKGHEFGSHSVTHRLPQSWWEHATIEQYKDEIVGQRNNIHRFSGVPIEQIRGMRVPFLAMGSDNQFTMLLQNNFTYDASMSAICDPPAWPFTLHQPNKLTPDLCSFNPDDCPKKPYPLWEVALNLLYMVGRTDNCTAAMVDGCRPVSDPGGQPSKEAALEYLRLNFRRHHDAEDRPPFGINMHAAWFQVSPFYFDAMRDFVDELLRLKDVWIVPAFKVIEWIRTPTPLSKLDTFEPFSCKK